MHQKQAIIIQERMQFKSWELQPGVAFLYPLKTLGNP